MKVISYKTENENQNKSTEKVIVFNGSL